MKVYKEKQFLIFDMEDGRTCRYDFSTNETIGFSGSKVNSLNGQLKGYTIEDVFNSCSDPQYAKFLRFIKDKCSHHRISNLGTILSYVNRYSDWEQVFAAGCEDLFLGYNRLPAKLSEIPKGMLKTCKEYKIMISSELLDIWKEFPNQCYSAYRTEFMSLEPRDITVILKSFGWSKTSRQYINYIAELIREYHYNSLDLLHYFDRLKTFEAIEFNNYSMLYEYFDYVYMMSTISKKFDRYPRHFLTTHQIATRNYNRLKQEFDEQKFAGRINHSYEMTIGRYSFIYPSCIQDIRDEAVQQSNCVASYIDRVIDGGCDILFMRYSDSKDSSLVTLEVRNNQIVQAKQRFNYEVTAEQQEAIETWNRRMAERKGAA